MPGDRPKPFQFSLRSLFVLTFLVSAVLSLAATLGKLMAAFFIPIMVAADLYRRASIEMKRQGETSLAVAWALASVLMALLGIWALYLILCR